MPPTPPKPSPAPPLRKILLVEGDPEMRRAIAGLLVPDFDVVTARGAREALLVLATGEIFDGALVDLQMPGIDASQTIDLLLKVAPLLGERAIVLTSGSAADALRAWAEGLGPARVLRKPPDRDLLVATLHERIELFPERPLVPTKSTLRPRRRK